MPVVIIGIIIFIIYKFSKNKKSDYQNNKNINLNVIQKPEKIIKASITNSSITNINIDNSIIDVTNQDYKIDFANNKERKNNDVPHWTHHYVYSYSEINTASPEQKLFYEIFKSNFLNNICLDTKGNSNYEFILLFNLIDDYENHRNISKTEQHLHKLSENYPQLKFYAYDALIKKLQQLGDYDIINILNKKQGSFYSYHRYQANENTNNYDSQWGIGNKYKTQLKLSENEVNILNKIWYSSNNFCGIEYCCIEILKFYLIVIFKLASQYTHEGTTIDAQFLTVADIIARKHYKYKNGSQNYKYCIETTTRELYSHIFRHCENAVRDYYGHKRKINIDTNYTNEEAKIKFETEIISKVAALLPELILNVALPNEATEVELNAQNTTRWKTKFEEIITNYNKNPKEFIDSITFLGLLNKKNPSIENIFFEASKFISKYDKQSALSLYLHYLHHDLKSTTFDNKQFTKTIQKNLFKTNEQLHDFEIIISELIKDNDLDKALKCVSKIYEIKRKKIQLDTTSIKEVQQLHSGTVELLNEYLNDDFEDENNIIKSQEISSEEIKIEVTQKTNEIIQSPFANELAFSEIHKITLELFTKSNFSVSQSELEAFAKSNGVFKNQLVESINDTCYEFLDDVLIEEEEDFYIINTNYFQSISKK